MSDFSVFASRFNSNTNSLRGFDEALRYFKKPEIQKDPFKTADQVRKLLLVLKPISEMLTRHLSETVDLDEKNIVETLQKRHIRNWQQYRERIIQLNDKLTAGVTTITQKDFEILNDVADAIDTECANIFRRISGRT